MKRLLILLIVCRLISVSMPFFGQERAPRYDAADGAIVGHNIGSYNNRPLYINNSSAFVLTGDQPIVRLGKDQYLYGTFMLSFERKGMSKWLQQCDQITSIYSLGRMAWEVSDKAFPGLKVILEVLPMATSTGMAIRASAEGIEDGDRLVWTFGGAQWRKGENLSWKLDVMGQPELLKWGFIPGECKNNVVETSGYTCFVSLTDSTADHNRLLTVAGRCNSAADIHIGDASECIFTPPFKPSQSHDLPVLYGTIVPEMGKSVNWAFEAFNQPDSIDLTRVNDPENAFAEGLKRTESFQDRLKINTPDPYLNAVARASVAAVDGTWYPPVFRHGAMQWNNRFPGWRTIFGGTMYGWHSRVRDEARFYTDAQIKGSDKRVAKADPALLLTGQHPDSRFYGDGRINMDQDFYDMQTQFFDQVIEEWRFTADSELESFLRRALELHLIWMRDCFDPDDDGVYESYLNTWPTDSQWYNGGSTAEETSYAYRGHLAARDMARRAGDREAEKYHSQMLEKIKKGFFKKLWIDGKGHSGAYREQGGLERLHEDPWLYSIFLPIDAGLTSPLQAVESIYYSEWALQNDRMPAGGRRVWTSNWIPGMWSVRELWPGDNYHLALGYFKAGLPDDGWDIMRGTFMYSAFDHLVPGNLGSVQGGIDFGDCVHTFARTLVAGLFGYNPDYPNKKVRISPQFPSGWNYASIELPDVRIAFDRKGGESKYVIELARMANLELLLPVQCERVKNVTVNGENARWTLLPGIGRSMLQIDLPELSKAEVVIETGNPLPCYAPIAVEGDLGKAVQLKVNDAKIIEFEDPQGVLENERIEKGALTARLTANKGYHTVFVRVVTGEAPQWRVFRIRVDDPAGDARQASRFIHTVPANAKWEYVDISSQLNADVKTIYQQLYLTPRPNTVSARLGTDGYSPWTFPYWKTTPPSIEMDQVDKLLDNKSRLITPQGIPFSWNGGMKNIAFTSLWNNYPQRIDFPVNESGDAAYFLVSGSTNVMQCHIANAVIRLNYADGRNDSLELIPPVNFWNLCKIDPHPTAAGQNSRADYTSEIDRFCMPAILPETVQLGKNCRAMLLNLRMRRGVELKSITLEALSQEVVIGLMGVSIMTEKK
jgi:hypothetical protein